jgi:two-component system, OmpR family, response regulator
MLDATLVQAGGKERTMTAVRAFIVEDSALVLRELAAELQQTSAIRVVASSDSEGDALKTMRVAAGAYDLIVIDVFLKQGSGLRVLRDAKVLQRQARVVVLTNYATLDVRKRCISLGADRVFDKSRQLEEFIDYCAAIARADERPDDGPPTVPAGEA